MISSFLVNSTPGEWKPTLNQSGWDEAAGQPAGRLEPKLECLMTLLNRLITMVSNV